MSEIIIRSATDYDKAEVAKTIVSGFRDDFSKLSKNLDNVVRTLESGIDIERFFIAKDGDETIGVIACTDCNGRAVIVNKADCRKYLGFVIGTIAAAVMAFEFSKPLLYPQTTGYIEFVAVAESARKKGLATKMLHTVVEQTDYKEYMLDVTNMNIAAQKCYRKFGFAEVKRERVRFAKQKGFSEKVYMRYVKQEG